MHLKIQEVLMSTLYTFKDGGTYLFYNFKKCSKFEKWEIKKKDKHFFIR